MDKQSDQIFYTRNIIQTYKTPLNTVFNNFREPLCILCTLLPTNSLSQRNTCPRLSREMNFTRAPGRAKNCENLFSSERRKRNPQLELANPVNQPASVRADSKSPARERARARKTLSFDRNGARR